MKCSKNSGLKRSEEANRPSRARPCCLLLNHVFLCIVLLSIGPAANVSTLQAQTPAAEGDTVRVLYIEGEPRFEYKFIRRAVEDRPSIRMESVVFLESDSRQENEPLVTQEDFSREDLQTKDVLILGNLGREAFSDLQLEAIANWVESGGNLLMLGGPNALALGGWADSPLDALLPIEPYSPAIQRQIRLPSEARLHREPLEAAMIAKQREMKRKSEALARSRSGLPPLPTPISEANSDDRARVNAEIDELKREQARLKQEMEGLPRGPSEGLSSAPLQRRDAVTRDYILNKARKMPVEVEPSAVDHPALAFEEGIDGFLEGLPALDVFQLVAMPRDEAVVLLRGRDDPSFTVLAYAERGKGICAVLTASSTWHWQMNAEIASDDTRHERFWQQLLSWLGSKD